MNIFLVRNQELISLNTAVVSLERLEEALNIKQLKVGHEIEMGLEESGLGRAKITAINGLTAKLNFTIHSRAAPQRDIHVMMAIPRPQMLKRVFETTATLGIRKLVLLLSDNSQKSYAQSKRVSHEFAVKCYERGMQQGTLTSWPEFEIYPNLDGFLCEKDRFSMYSQKLVAEPRANCKLLDFREMVGNGIVLLGIGPEAGWSEREMNLLGKQGFNSFSLGSHIMRVETVFPWIVGQLDLLRNS